MSLRTFQLTFYSDKDTENNYKSNLKMKIAANSNAYQARYRHSDSIR